MKTRLFAMGAAFCTAAALAACGGGGGGGGGPVTPVTTPTPIVTPTPTAVPTLNPYGCVGSQPYAIARKPEIAHPIAAGDSFSYTGTIAQTYTESAPCPQPTSTTNATVGVSTSALATTMPNSGGSGSDLRSTETDTYLTSTQTTTTDESVQNTSSAYLLYATKTSDANGNSIDTVYTTPHELDQLPETSASWGLPGSSYVNNPAGSIHETFADGSSAVRTIASDGSYIDTQTFPNSQTWTLTINGAINSQPADGSGTYVGPVGATYSYAAPSGGTITLNINSGQDIRTFPVWFSAPVTPYISDSFVDSGSASIDPSCSNAISSTGNKIIETQNTLDPVVGYKETRTITSYNVNGYGAVCVKIDDTLNTYYDYNSDTTAHSYQSKNGQPDSVNEIVEVLNMTAPLTPYPSIRTASAARETQGVSAAAVAQRLAAIDLQREVQRMQILHAFVQHVLAGKGAQK